MLREFISSLNRWNSTTTERQKLQHTYIAVTMVVVLAAGITSLFNANAGHKVTYLAVIAILAFLTNALVWNFLNSAILSKLSSRTKKK